MTKTNLTLFAVGLIAAVVNSPGGLAQGQPSLDEAYLDGLQGQWLMEGAVGGKPVRYRAEGRRVLQGGFLSFHMQDAAATPHYEATVYLGFDPKAKDYIAHWLDRFGAAGARVVATGRREGDRLMVIFPYPEGAFRDTFTRDRKQGTWTLLLESQAADKSWTTFASYSIVRPPK